MRLTVFITTLFISSVSMAQLSGKDTESLDSDKRQKTESNELLDHKKAERPESNQVNVIIKKNQIIEEYRHKGELIMVKVIPSDGVPYYIDPQARNKRTGAHSDLINSGVEPVHWVIKRF